ncbi:uncharacterized protein B0I36DRAFT_133922 [Microdochium trichocladiopsis]|uniref:Uncharacterized protein n=1 Tax=Microdochium trichocladiopsis TaxID=1682393 RepID=A0A9P8Y330_9PEZI|nr:uncharacterized protein B0I36DRAFT_133922 [Microdochium trichocladiopsis]KAH7029579.1 hypothetical protein B0I36DRAFT_133922 [Microdochium trichocladiopsis]
MHALLYGSGRPLRKYQVMGGSAPSAAPAPRAAKSLTCCLPWPPTLSRLSARGHAHHVHRHTEDSEHETTKLAMSGTRRLSFRPLKQGSRRASTFKRTPGYDVMEVIPAYRLDWRDLEHLLNQWDPHVRFAKKMTVEGDKYVVYLKSKLGSVGHGDLISSNHPF